MIIVEVRCHSCPGTDRRRRRSQLPPQRAIPATPEQPDGLGRPVVDQTVRVAIGVDVVQSNGVRVWRDVDAESRVVPVFEDPSGDPEEQRDVVRLVVFRPRGRQASAP